MMVEVGHSGVQAQKFLSAFSSFEALLTSLLTPCRTVGLLDQVITTRCGNHLLMVDIDQTWDLPDRSAVTPQLIGVNKSFQTLGNTVQDRNGTKLDLKNCGQYGFLQQCLSFALPRSTWPF